MNRKEQALLDHRMRAAMESEDIWGVKNKQQRQRYARAKNGIKNGKKAPTKAKSATIVQNNTSSNNINSQSSNKTNINTGNQTTASTPQNNNATANNNSKGKSSTGSKPVNQKPGRRSLVKSNLWQLVPGGISATLDNLNTASPIHNEILPYDGLWDTVKNQGGGAGNALEVVDAIFSPTNSNIWKDIGSSHGDFSYSVWSNIADLFSDDAGFVNNIGATARDLTKNFYNVAANVIDWGGYAVPYYNLGKIGRDLAKTGLDNVYDFARDYETIKDYSYKNLGFDDYIGDDLWRASKAGFNNLFSRLGENRDFYQRGRFSLNEMLSAMAKDIENHTDKNSPEYKDLVDKFERFNNLAKSSDFYWATKKEMDASDLSEEDFFKSKSITPQQFELSKQNAYALHNLGSNLALNEGSGNKRSDYVEGNYSYQDYTDAVNAAKRSLEGDSADIDTDTLNAAINIGTDVGKAITGKPVDNTTGTGTNAGTNNTANENLQSSLTPDYLTEFYKKFDKKYGYDPAKGRFNIWL